MSTHNIALKFTMSSVDCLLKPYKKGHCKLMLNRYLTNYKIKVTMGIASNFKTRI